MQAISGKQGKERGYRSTQVCRIVGLTYKQLDYYARTRFIVPSIQAAEGCGSQRLYSFKDILQLKIVKRLLDAGVSLQKIRKTKSFLESLHSSLHNVTLLSDGNTIYACYSPEEIVDTLQRGQGVFGVAVGKVLEELEGDIERLDGGAAMTKSGRSGSEISGQI